MKFAKWLLIAVVLLGITLVASTIALSDSRVLKPLAVFLIKKYTGRELVVTGPVELQVSLQPSISVSGIQLSNPDWTNEPHLFSAQYVQLDIDLPSLLERRLDILSIQIEGATVDLEERADGARSWDLFPADGQAGSSIELVLRRMAVGNTRVRLVRPEQPIWQLSVENMTERVDARDMLVLDGHGTLNNYPWQLEGSIGTLNGLMAATAVELDIKLILDSLTFSVQGQIGNTALFESVDVRLVVSGDDASVFGALLGNQDAFIGNVALHASLHSAAEGLQVDARGHVASFEIDIDADVLEPLNLDGIEATFNINGPNASIVAPGFKIPTLLAAPFQLTGKLKRHSTKVQVADLQAQVADITLNLDADFVEFPSFASAVVAVEITGKNFAQLGEALGRPGLASAPYKFTAQAKREQRTVLATLEVSDQAFTAEGLVGDLPQLIGSQLQLSAKGPDLAALTRVFGLEDYIPGPYSFGANLNISESVLSLNEIVLESDAGTGKGAVAISREPFAHTLDLNFEFASPNLAHTLAYFEVEDLPAEPVRVAGQLEGKAGGWRLISASINSPIAKAQGQGQLGHLPELTGLDLKLEIQGPSLNRLLGQKLPDAIGTQGFTLTTGIRGKAQAIELQDFELNTRNTKLQLAGQLPLSGSLLGTKLAVTAQGPRLAELLPHWDSYQPPDQPYRLQGEMTYQNPQQLILTAMELTLGRTAVSIEGTLNLQSSTATELFIKASGASLADLGHLRDFNLLQLPYKFEAKLVNQPTVLELSGINATWGDSDFSGQTTFDWSQPQPKVIVEGSSQYFDWPFEANQETTATSPATVSDRLLPQQALPFDLLNQANARVDITIANFAGFSEALQNVRIGATLSDGTLSLAPLAYDDSIGEFNLTGFVRQMPEGGEVDLVVKGTDLDLDLFIGEDQPEDTVPRYNINATFNGQGTSVAGIAATLNGKVLVVMTKGEIDNRALDILGGGFLDTAFETLNPFARTQPYTQIDCAVLNTEIRDGVLLLQPGLVVRSDKLNMFTIGQVNLGEEQLDLSLATQPRRGLGISPGAIVNPFFKIGGSFKSPKLKLDSSSAALAYGVATATGGLSILAKGFWDRIHAQKNPCEAFVQATDS